MNRKTKRYAAGGETDEDAKKGIFSGSPAEDDSDTYAPKTRSFSTTGPEKKKSTPKPKPKAETEAAKPESKADKYADLPLNRIGKAIEGTFRGRREEEPAKAETKPEPKSDKYSDAPLNRIGRAIAGTFSKGNKAGGAIKMASGGKVSSASSRGDGIAQRGKTRGKMC